MKMRVESAKREREGDSTHKISNEVDSRVFGVFGLYRRLVSVGEVPFSKPGAKRGTYTNSSRNNDAVRPRGDPLISPMRGTGGAHRVSFGMMRRRSLADPALACVAPPNTAVIDLRIHCLSKIIDEALPETTADVPCCQQYRLRCASSPVFN